MTARPSLPITSRLGMMPPSMARLAFFGTPDFALPALRTLHARHELALVVCTPNAPAGRGLLPAPCPVKAEAERLGLPLAESKLGTDAEIEALARRLADLRLDAAVMVAFGPPIPERVLAIPARGFVMAHASLLPRWRGAAPIERALEEGDAESGVSLVRLTTDRYAGDLVSAALRHIRVAEHLVAEGADRALDEAFHIAGFGPECAQAACLGEEWFARAIGHGFEAAQAESLRLLLDLDPRARRYLPADWGDRYQALKTWTVQSRYLPTGTFDLTRATAMTREAREAVDRVATALWADGLLDEGALR